MTDQAADPYCQDEHHFVSINVPNFPIWIRQCSSCGFYDSQDMNDQLAKLMNRRHLESKSDEHAQSCTCYEDFWQELVETDGNLDLEKVVNELHDYKTLLDNVPIVYDRLTGGRISKANTDPDAVVSAAEDAFKWDIADIIVSDLLPEIEDPESAQKIMDFARGLDLNVVIPDES